MPTCSASFFKKDSRQAGMTTLKSYVNLLNAFVLIAVNLYAAGDLIAEGNVGIGTTVPNTKVDIAGDIALRAGAFTAVNGNNNNINIGGTSFIRITGPTAAFTITGISGGVNGNVVILYNAATYNMTVANENTNSTATNRITTLTGSGVVTTGVGAITLIYDSTASRWIVTSARL